MKKTAKKKTRPKAPSHETQRSLHLAAVMRRTLFAFVIQEGMKAFDLMLEQERTEVCGPAHSKGGPDEPVRWGHVEGRLVMGGQRVTVRKPRVRHSGKEVRLPTWAEFADHDPLDARTMEQMVLGVSTREYERSLDELPAELGAHGTSKSAASRRFVGRTKAHLDAWLKRDLSELSIVAIMLDGLGVAEHSVVLALGIDESGKKHPLGLWVGATENAVVVGELLDNLIDRGLDAQGHYLFVIDGARRCAKPSAIVLESVASCNDAKSTSAAMCLATCPSRCRGRHQRPCVMRTRAGRDRRPSADCFSSSVVSKKITPMPRRHFAKVSTKRSRSRIKAYPGALSERYRRPIRSRT